MLANKIVVRPLERPDYSAVADLIQQWRPSAARALHLRKPRTHFDAVAVLGTEIVGWINYDITTCNSELISELEGSRENWTYIVEIFVYENYRRRGYADELLAYAESDGRNAGVRFSVVTPEQGEGEAGFTHGLFDLYANHGYELMEPSSRYGNRRPWVMGLSLSTT